MLESIPRMHRGDGVQAAKFLRMADKHKTLAGKLNSAVKAGNRRPQQLHNDDP